MNEEEVTILAPLLGEHQARMVCALNFLAQTCAHMGRQINQYEAMLTMQPPPPEPAQEGEVIPAGGEP